MAPNSRAPANQKVKRGPLLPDEGGGLSLAELAGFRCLAYRLLATMLLSPNGERLMAVAAMADELNRHSEVMVSSPIYSQWKWALDSLAALDGHRAEELEEEYVRLFMHHPDRTPCLPYESVYVDLGGQAVGWVTALVEREYATAGLSLSPSLHDMPDHVAVELEFMAFLCAQEASAWEREALAEGIQAIERQESFLERHLARWLPQWAKELGAVAGDGVYSLTAATAGSFVCQDNDLLKAVLERMRRLSGATLEPAVRDNGHLG